MINALAALLLLIAPTAVENDDFNCPPQKGKLTFEDGWANAIPNDLRSQWPDETTVDFVCAINNTGRFTGCKFAVRPNGPDITPEIRSSVLKAMPRMMRYIRSDTPNQPCVANKLKFNFSDPFAEPSKPPPDEAAGERVVPD